MFKQEREPSFETVQHDGQRLTRQGAQQLVEQGVAEWGVPQRAPDHGIESIRATRCMSVTASADLPMPPMPKTLTTRHCWHSSQSVRSASSQFTPVEARAFGSVPPVPRTDPAGAAPRQHSVRAPKWPVQPMSQRPPPKGSVSQVSSSGTRDACAFFHKARISSASCPVWNVLRRKQSSIRQLEMVRGGPTGAGLPTDHGLAGDAQKLGQPGLGQDRLPCGGPGFADRNDSRDRHRREPRHGSLPLTNPLNKSQ